ncbi:hypothetical protein ACFPER_03210 [Agromyces aurantiacus]|uniref:Uncharacterized protein n=1 Tax=Agromyces aurantiacus TaxID=165814 RepID=A0ABV9R2X5_9MICO|nr:hypothetical protein [Agromyces aurantiacus]MBM7506101.1 MFS family permease [Agromyces aurantiacus]
MDQAREAPRLGRWVGFTVLGESLGFLVPVTGFALAATLGLEAWATWALLVIFGAGEGALLGLGQSLGLRGSAAEVPVGRWVAATAVAASAAWSIGMLLPTFADLGVEIDWASPAAWAVAACAGLALLATIPLLQWPVLAQARVPRAWRWVPLNMGAWLVGIVFTFLPSPFIDESSPVWLVFASFAVGGVLMAATVALLTGLGLRRMVRGSEVSGDRPAPSPSPIRARS